jgi:hypothetical protein
MTSTQCTVVQFNMSGFLLQFIELFQFRLASGRTQQQTLDLHAFMVFKTERGCALCEVPTEAKETVEHRSLSKTDSECGMSTVTGLLFQSPCLRYIDVDRLSSVAKIRRHVMGCVLQY